MDSGTSRDHILRIAGLTVGFAARDRLTPVLRAVSLDVRRGEIQALVGESGCGKTLTALAVLGLLPPAGRVLGGRIHLDGAGDLLRLGERQRRSLRGRRIAMIFQDAMSALNPVLTIGSQIAETLRRHRGLKRRGAWDEARRLLELVAMPDATRRLRSYPHQLSGGQLQRALIAVALASRPDLLLADEPTTALDVTVQAQVLELLIDLQRRMGLTVLLITHDLGVVAQCSDRVAVMYAGQIVEEAEVGELFRNPAHPYTRGLLRAVPHLGRGGPEDRPPGGPVAGIAGRVPEPGALPRGCSFHPRCPRVMDRCRREPPQLYPAGNGDHRSRCFLQPSAAPVPPPPTREAP